MKAVVYDKYGPPDVLHLAEVDTPVPNDDQVLIRVHAVSVNGSDREALVGKPFYVRIGGLRRPGNRILGSDVAGRVVAVGRANKRFNPGDEVFGELPGYNGGFAEYVCTTGTTMVPKPASLSFEQAASIPQAGVIAWQGIRAKGKVEPGQKVLINGAGGSAGSFAIQVAKLSGAEVTGVDNADKLEFMRGLGADHVIDYQTEDFTKGPDKYDLILDLYAHRSVFAYQRALRPNGTYFFVGGGVRVLLQVLLLGPLIRTIRGKKMRMLVVAQDRKVLVSVSELCEAGRVVPVIDRTYPLEEVPEALRHVVDGRAKGKVVISLVHEDEAD